MHTFTASVGGFFIKRRFTGENNWLDEAMMMLMMDNLS